jgi:hypothetical protein
MPIAQQFDCPRTRSGRSEQRCSGIGREGSREVAGLELFDQEKHAGPDRRLEPRGSVLELRRPLLESGG